MFVFPTLSLKHLVLSTFVIGSGRWKDQRTKLHCFLFADAVGTRQQQMCKERKLKPMLVEGVCC